MAHEENPNEYSVLIAINCQIPGHGEGANEILTWSRNTTMYNTKMNGVIRNMTSRIVLTSNVTPIFSRLFVGVREV